MRLTKRTTYAIRILMYCAANDERLSHVPTIASVFGVSKLFLFHILRPLTQAGLIETIRGRNGGIRLARAAKSISLLDVVTRTEDGFSMGECRVDNYGTGSCPLTDQCAFHEALSAALGSFFDVLRGHSIQDLISARATVRQLLGINEISAARALQL